jgi:hypothetical protein
MNAAVDPARSGAAAGSTGGGRGSLPSTTTEPQGAAPNPYQVLAAAINAQLQLVYHLSVTLVQFPTQGNFLWYYENANQVFNNGTSGYLSARVSPGDAAGLAKLSGPGSYPNAYAQLLSQVEYGISSADQAAHNQNAINQAANGNALLGELRQATTVPTPANGGIQTVDPSTGQVSSGYQVGYGVNTALATISNGLQSGQPTITVQVPNGSTGTATISYSGCQLVPVQASAWQQATDTGWFDPDPLAQAAANGLQDVTGYRFISQPTYNLGPLEDGGNFGQLVTLLISNTPVVSFSSISAKAVTNAVTPAASAADFYDSLSLLKLDQPATSEAFFVTDAVPTVPQLQQSAYVVGACFGFIATG